MQLEEVRIPRAEARQSYLDYRRQVGRTNDPVARRELEEIANAFRLAAQTELALIALTPTIKRGGSIVRTLVMNRGSDRERRTNYLLPQLAVAPAASQFVFTLGVRRNGAVEFCDRLGVDDRYRSGRLDVDAGFEVPHGFDVGRRIQWDRSAWSAQVPICPPKHRPAGSSSLRTYWTLWEVDDWTWRSDPAPSRDPALLKHVGGDIYAVVATWDLSPLELLVLSGRRLPE